MAIKHRIRVDGNGKTMDVDFTSRKAIIAHCRECMGYNAAEVRRCTDQRCALYPFRTHDTPKSTV